MIFAQIISDFKARKIPIAWLDKVKFGFKCIGCGNGSGKKGTGATLSKDGTRLLCGKCQKAFSYIDVACFHYGIDLTNFADGVQQLCKIESIPLDNFNSQFSTDADTLKQKQAADFFLHQFNDNLKDFLNSQGGTWRGLDFRTLSFLHWKFCPNFKHCNNNFTFPAILIPNDNGGLLARQVDGDAKSNLKPVGISTIFLPTNPKFILAVEGAINAASILQALGTNLDFAIIAANGVGNKNLLINKILQLFPKKNIPVAIAFDNDDAGQNAASDVLKSLSEASFITCTINITQTPKIDLNDVLRQNNGEHHLYTMLHSSIKIALAEFEKINADKIQKLFGTSSDFYFSHKFQLSLDKRKKFADRKTGFTNLDDKMGAFLPGVYILGGLPALGKTTFALQLLEQLAKNGEHCIFCSYEMGEDELYSKRISRSVYLLESLNGSREVETPLTSTQILRSKFYEHKENFDKVLEYLKLEKIPLFIWELDEVDIDKLLTRLDKICANLEKPPVICIDYLQILASNTEKTKAAIDDILRRLKNFQRKTNSTFIVISSLNRFNYYSDISFEAFKESGNIEYSADVIWGLQFLLDERNHQAVEKAKRENPRLVQLKCLKNRFGSIFDIAFSYYPASDFFNPLLDGTYTDYKPDNSNIHDTAKNAEVDEKC